MPCWNSKPKYCSAKINKLERPLYFYRTTPQSPRTIKNMTTIPIPTNSLAYDRKHPKSTDHDETH